MLDVHGLQVRYGHVDAVRSVDLSVAAGEITCIVGPNGAGKTSTLLGIAGAVAASGSVRLDGIDVARWPAEKIARSGLSLVPEGRGVFASLSVRENLLLGVRSGAARTSLDNVFTRFPILSERLDMPAGRLSGGEQQQLVIARALLTRPKALLIDEPSLGLAPQMVALVSGAITALRAEGVAVLVVEQSTRRALEIADKIYVMRNGTVSMAASASEIGSADDLKRAYFGELFA
jgi:branched-chain amino acid transport system ATP-binding protein